MQIIPDTANTYAILADGCNEEGVDFRLPYTLHKVLFWVMLDDNSIVGITDYDICDWNEAIRIGDKWKDNTLLVGYQIGSGDIDISDLLSAISISEEEFGQGPLHWEELVSAARGKWTRTVLAGKTQNTLIEDQPMSNSLRRVLMNAGFKDMTEFSEKKERELLKVKNFGRGRLNELKAVLKSMGLSVKEGM